MNRTPSILLKIVLPLATAIAVTAILYFFFLRRKRKRAVVDDDDDPSRGSSSGRRRKRKTADVDHIDNSRGKRELAEAEAEAEAGEDLITFPGGEGLTICDILEAPGEVIGKSKHGTLYRADLQRLASVKLLRFLRPACAASATELIPTVHVLGAIRHPNLVPLLGFYAGPKGEKLLVHPFYAFGNLGHLIRLGAGGGDRLKWSTVYELSVGITQGLDHLHTAFQSPVLHGNLKSKNVLMDHNYRPYLSDFSLHLLLNTDAGQQMLQTLSSEGYKAPEVIKVKDFTKESDIYSLGIIFLELLTGREPVNETASPDEEPYLPNYVRDAVIEDRKSNLYRPNFLSRRKGDIDEDNLIVTEECILKFFHLAMACCSPSRSLRPDTRQVLRKLKEIVVF